MKPGMEIILSNTAEAFLQILQAAAYQPGGLDRMKHETALSQRALFWLSDEKLVLTPTAIPEEVLGHCKRVTGWQHVINWSLVVPELDLCAAVARDSELLNKLASLIRHQTHARLSAYAVTPAYVQLARLLEQTGCQFSTLESLSGSSAELQAYLDSKAGFRAEMARIPNTVSIPEGFVCPTLRSATDAIHQFLGQSRGCVVKSNFGESGWGTLIFHSGQPAPVATDLLAHEAAVDSIWNSHPLIVEEYIESAAGSFGHSPSGEAVVTDEGASFTYCCSQIMANQTEFQGVLLGGRMLPDQVQSEVARITNAIGAHYHAIGYRGYFDVDFILRKDERLFALETNARRTGGTHAHDLMLALGLTKGDWLGHSEDSIKFAEPISNASDVMNKIKPLLFEPGQNRSGIVPTIIDARSNNFGYVAIGRRYEDVVDLVLSIKGLT